MNSTLVYSISYIGQNIQLTRQQQRNHITMKTRSFSRATNVILLSISASGFCPSGRLQKDSLGIGVSNEHGRLCHTTANKRRTVLQNRRQKRRVVSRMMQTSDNNQSGVLQGDPFLSDHNEIVLTPLVRVFDSR